jgi:hypothetical protein
MRISAHGIRADLPAGWDGRISRRPGGQAVLQAATFRLPLEDGDFATVATSTMPADGVVVVILEYDRELAGSGLFAAPGPPDALAAADFSSATMLRRIPGQAGVQRFFSHDGRAFGLYAVIGSRADAGALAARATALLRTLRLS